jgi:molybdopterin/thiamine biosynthesis adenylyltransferase/nitroreductase
MTRPQQHAGDFRAQILDADDPVDARQLQRLQTDPYTDVIDHRSAMMTTLRQLRPAPPADVLTEATRWVYYPWRRTVIAMLGPRGYRTVRLDRNRHLITSEEQNRLGQLRIGVVGLSVGHVIAHTLAAEGLCGMLRLADFDELELSNLNRVPATVVDLGLNKAVVAGRRVAELDPDLNVDVMTAGLTPETLDAFLHDIDIVIEECDSFDMKIMIREAARERRLPVLMATSDRGLVDVERYDLEPQRPVMHGLLGTVDARHFAGLSRQDRIPYMLKHLDATRSSGRLIASLVEVDHTLVTWPQRAGDVAIGAAAMAEAVRRIGLGEPLGSGQVRIDVSQALDSLATTTRGAGSPAAVTPAQSPSTVIAEAARRAPSGGNSQPWKIGVHAESVVIHLAPEQTSSMDVAFRGSAVAVGAAVFNARVAAAALGVLGPTEWETSSAASPLTAYVRLGRQADAELARLYDAMLARETNRRLGTGQQIDHQTVTALHEAAKQEGARLTLLTSRDGIEQAATNFAEADKARFLTPRLHQEMVSELRWPGEQPADTGIDVRSLEVDDADLAVLDILRRADVMALLAQWNAGDSLGDNIAKRVRGGSALGIITVAGHELADFARGGAAAEAIWIAAQQRGLAVQPISPVYLHAVHDEELWKLSPSFAPTLLRLQADLRRLADTRPEESHVLVLNLAHAGPASVRSRRRPLTTNP